MLERLFQQINWKDIIIFLFVLHTIYIYYHINTIKEGFNQNLIDLQAVKSLAEVARKLQQGGITIPGNVHIRGHLTTDGNTYSKGKLHVYGGSQFQGHRHIFQDVDTRPHGRWLRVGGAWGKPGIAAEHYGELILGNGAIVAPTGPGASLQYIH